MQPKDLTPLSNAKKRPKRAPSRYSAQARHLLWLGCLCALGIGWVPGCGTPVCRADKDCEAPTPHCVLAQCQACTEDSHCKAGQRCERQGGICKNTAAPPDGGPGDQTKPGEEPTTREVPLPDLVPDVPAGPCVPGASRSCYPAPAATEGKGSCIAGNQSCGANQKWGECKGALLPQPEICDGQDNDCNGQTDDNWPTRGLPCTIGSGECSASGTYICPADGTGPVVCDAKPPNASAEICDGKDNNCDGKIDETYPDKGTPCGVGIGACRSEGTNVCGADGKSLICDVKPKAPKPETCNNIDDDCDGTTDEGISCPCKDGETRDCGTDRGECKKGKQTCKNGQWSSDCDGETKPTTETCNGKDDDCDGSTDESISRPCFPSSSGCQESGGTYQCAGTCLAGVQTCQGGKWRTCSGAVTPTKERCDGKDNDCDGKTDESYTNLGKTCTVGVGDCKSTGKYVCQTNGSTTRCDAQAGSNKPEVCDGKDNDCDGRVDESPTDVNKACTVPNTQGACAQGLTTCSNGSITCRSISTSRLEQCNGLDDDCDGDVDENIPGTGVPCGGVGPCRKELVCQNGKIECTLTAQAPTEVCRDRQDNDCDGSTDEICGPAHKWAVTNPSGSTIAGNFSVSRANVGRYRTNQSCSSAPVFAVPLSKSSHSVTYQCGILNRYAITVHNDNVTTTNYFIDKGLSIVVPSSANGEVYGIVDELNCYTSTTNKECSLDEDEGSIKVHETSEGVYELTSPGCSNANQPIFVMPHRDNRNYRTTYTVDNKGGKCIVNIYDHLGAPISNKFAFWLPNTNTNATATTSLTGIAASQDFGDQNAKWAWKANGTTKKTYEMTFHSWAKPSAVLVSPIHTLRSPPSTLPSQILSIEGITSGVQIYPFDEGTGSPVAAPAARFHIIFVQ